MHAAGGVAHLGRIVILFRQRDILIALQRVARLFRRERSQRFEIHHLCVAVKHRRLHAGHGNH